MKLRKVRKRVGSEAASRGEARRPAASAASHALSRPEPEVENALDALAQAGELIRRDDGIPRYAVSEARKAQLEHMFTEAAHELGETQALVTSTLGTASDAQRLDYIEGESEKKFMLHYNFPPFSVGEVPLLRGPGRREIGQGALA